MVNNTETPHKRLPNRLFTEQLKALVEPRKYNPGLNVDRQFEYRGTMYKSPAVRVKDRKAFFDESDHNGATRYSIMDVVNLRQADLAINNLANTRSADLLLNDLSHTVVAQVGIFNAGPDAEKAGKKVDFCRYGGDEFAFFYVNMTREEINAFESKLRIEVANVNGFFRPNLRSEVIEMRPVEVEFKNHDRPESDDYFGQIIFDHFKGNAVLLEPEEIEKLKTKFDNDYRMFRIWAATQAPDNFYPDVRMKYKEKIEYLAGLNPALTEQIRELMVGAERFGDISYYLLEKHLREMLSDPLLKKPILSNSDMLENIRMGNITRVWTKDMKYMKELNKESYADGDNAIRTLWENINRCVHPDDAKKLVISRFGGTFLIGLKEGEQLSNETIHRLDGLDKITYQAIGTNAGVEIPIGAFHHEVPQALVEYKYGRRKELNNVQRLTLIKLMGIENGRLFIMPDEAFYEKVAMNLLSPAEPDNFDSDSLNWDNVFSQDYNPDGGMSPVSLNHDYFISKRASQRLAGLERALDNNITVMIDKLDKQIHRFNKGHYIARIKQRYQGILKQVRDAMNYSYSHSMLHPEELG